MRAVARSVSVRTLMPGNARRRSCWSEILRQELANRRVFRDLFERHERIIGQKVRQLRAERGWTQQT